MILHGIYRNNKRCCLDCSHQEASVEKHLVCNTWSNRTNGCRPVCSAVSPTTSGLHLSFHALVCALLLLLHLQENTGWQDPVCCIEYTCTDIFVMVQYLSWKFLTGTSQYMLYCYATEYFPAFKMKCLIEFQGLTQIITITRSMNQKLQLLVVNLLRFVLL